MAKNILWQRNTWIRKGVLKSYTFSITNLKCLSYFNILRLNPYNERAIWPNTSFKKVTTPFSQRILCQLPIKRSSWNHHFRIVIFRVVFFRIRTCVHCCLCWCELFCSEWWLNSTADAFGFVALSVSCFSYYSPSFCAYCVENSLFCSRFTVVLLCCTCLKFDELKLCNYAGLLTSHLTSSFMAN